MLSSVVYFVLGLGALVVGAEALVRGASKLALAFGVSPLVIGLTVVAFGTSSPEMAVSVGSAARGQVDIAIGNVVGSNIFNVLFILGLCALVAPLVVARQIVRQEVPVMIGASVLLGVFSLDGRLQALECALLAVLLAGYTVFLVVQSRSSAGDRGEDFAAEMRVGTPRWDDGKAMQIALVVVGLGLLVLGADWFVGAAIDFARRLGISDTIVGLTIVAAGTSMPEVAASLLATYRGHRDIAVGNVIGSTRSTSWASSDSPGSPPPGTGSRWRPR